MNAATLTASEETGVVADPLQFLRDNVFRWSSLSRNFLDTERSEMLLKEPTAQDLTVHRHGCNWLLKIGRCYQVLATDIDDQGMSVELEGRLGQLEESWRQFHGPQMSNAEADALIAKHFPE
jgi:hypothetical protein